jgi:hypothetical protein
MPGTDFRKTREAIVDAYSEDDLRITLREVMDLKLDVVVGPGNLNTRVFELLQWAEMHGREAELIRAAAMARPRNARMQEVYQQYGMAVPVNLVHSGAPLTGGSAGEAGFEKTVRAHIPFFDIVELREHIAQAESRVCQVRFRGAAQGTGFLVGPDAVMTNYHVMEAVLKGSRPAAEVECVFDFKKLPDGSKMETPVALHSTRWNVDSSAYTAEEATGKPDRANPTTDQLDYAIVRLARPVGAEPWAAHPGSGAPSRGWVKVPAAQPAFGSPMGVIIAQHPNGWPMKLAIDTSAIDRGARPPLWVNDNGTRVRYATNTEGGSSGSPVFDLRWNLVALHHYGDPDRGHDPEWNQGVPIGVIRDRLGRTGKLTALGE